METNSCRKCGYTGNPPGSFQCSKCGTPLSASSKIENPFKLRFKSEPVNTHNCRSCGYVLAENIMICPNCNFDNDLNSRSGNNTISFDEFQYSKKEGFQLIPHNKTSDILSFTDKVVKLFRDLIDKKDLSISSENHAEIKNVDGKWYIENKSSNAATFIRVNNLTELKNGDVIILGQSKVYTFIDHEEKS